jgi:1-phosphofructokinase
VGAGDALLAGFLAAGARGASALAEGLAWGAAAVRIPDTRMPGPGELRRDQVHIHADPDPSRPLLI